MADYAGIRTALVTLLQAIPNIGQVHNRERWSDDWPSFLNLFAVTIASSSVIRGWVLTRTSKTEERDGSAYGTVMYQNEFLLRGMHGFSDANDSEGAFNALLELVCAALNANKSLGGLCVDWGVRPARVDIIEPRMFGQTMCHYAEVRFTVYTEETA